MMFSNKQFDTTFHMVKYFLIRFDQDFR